MNDATGPQRSGGDDVTVSRIRARFIDGPVGGLHYRTPTGSGLTDADGGFEVLPGEPVEFSLGDVVLGETSAKASITPADLFPFRPDRPALEDRRVINCARLVQSLGGLGDLAAGVTVDEQVRGVATGRIDFDLEWDAFGRQPEVSQLLQKFDVSLRSPEAAKNHLRRTLAGIKKLVDVRVPTRDGAYLLADVLRPIAAGQYPVIMRLGIYGRAFGTGSICNQADREAAERREDDWFADHRAGMSPMVRYAENAVSANAFDWVPRGYVLVRVDGRGVGPTPGELLPFSGQEAADYYDAIEWAASQVWANGSVGLLGASYSATNQWKVAGLQPPSLRAIIPWASDADAYRDLAYPGGILQSGYRQNWWNFVGSLQCRQPDADFVAELAAHPFDEPDFYGSGGQGPQSADFSQVEVPFLAAVSQTATLHGRAGFEAFRSASSPHRQLVVVAANYFSFLYRECRQLQFDFFDRFLKDEAGDDAEFPPVRLMMRTGRGEYQWRDEETWPLPGTDYQSWFLDAAPPVAEPGAVVPTYTLATDTPKGSATADYSAEWTVLEDRAATGVHFLSPPLTEPLRLAGHVTAQLWVSATATDMDLFVALRVIAPDGEEVHYAVRDRLSEEPVTWGCQKVSQRMVDPQRSGVRPWHTHRRVDAAPLRGPDEIVQADVELLAATAVIPAGHRLRLDVQPVEGPGGYRDTSGQQAARAYDRSYHDGATNTVHTGNRCPSRLVLPIVPAEPVRLGSRM